jgi:hypothetical protein
MSDGSGAGTGVGNGMGSGTGTGTGSGAGAGSGSGGSTGIGAGDTVTGGGATGSGFLAQPSANEITGNGAQVAGTPLTDATNIPATPLTNDVIGAALGDAANAATVPSNATGGGVFDTNTISTIPDYHNATITTQLEDENGNLIGEPHVGIPSNYDPATMQWTDNPDPSNFTQTPPTPTNTVDPSTLSYQGNFGQGSYISDPSYGTGAIDSATNAASDASQGEFGIGSGFAGLPTKTDIQNALGVDTGPTNFLGLGDPSVSLGGLTFDPLSGGLSAIGKIGGSTLANSLVQGDKQQSGWENAGGTIGAGIGALLAPETFGLSLLLAPFLGSLAGGTLGAGEANIPYSYGSITADPNAVGGGALDGGSAARGTNVSQNLQQDIAARAASEGLSINPNYHDPLRGFSYSGGNYYYGYGPQAALANGEGTNLGGDYNRLLDQAYSDMKGDGYIINPADQQNWDQQQAQKAANAAASQSLDQGEYKTDGQGNYTVDGTNYMPAEQAAGFIQQQAQDSNDTWAQQQGYQNYNDYMQQQAAQQAYWQSQQSSDAGNAGG